MSTTTTVGASAIPAPKFNIAALEREVEALVASGTKDLEFELRKERIDPYRIDITKPANGQRLTPRLSREQRLLAGFAEAER